MKSLGSLTAIQHNQITLTPEEKSNAVAFLEANSPLQNERAAERKLQNIFDGTLDIKKNSIVHDGDVKFKITKIEKPKGLTQDQIDRSERSLRLASLPGKLSTVTSALNKLASQSTTYEGDKMAMGAKITSYANDLRDLPIDAVLEAIDLGWDIFPSLAVLRSKAASFASARSTMLRIVNTWTPWSEADELENLIKRLEVAEFDARYFSVPGPNKHTKRADAAKAAIPRLEAAIEKITGVEVHTLSDDDLAELLAKFNQENPRQAEQKAAE